MAWTYCADILTDKGNSIAIMVNWVSAFIVTFISPIILDSWGIYILFLIYAIFMAVGSVITSIYFIETKDLSKK